VSLRGYELIHETTRTQTSYVLANRDKPPFRLASSSSARIVLASRRAAQPVINRAQRMVWSIDRKAGNPVVSNGEKGNGMPNLGACQTVKLETSVKSRFGKPTGPTLIRDIVLSAGSKNLGLDSASGNRLTTARPKGAKGAPTRRAQNHHYATDSRC